MVSLSRRDFLKITALAGTGLAASAALGRSSSLQLSETRSLMGTIVHLTVITPDEATGQLALDATFGEMERLITIFDHRRNDSPLAVLNREGQLKTAPAELTDVLARALNYSALTDGLFDVTIKPVLDCYSAGYTDIEEAQQLVDYRQITVLGNEIVLKKPGMAITLDGIAKGYIVDSGVTVLREHGFKNVVVESGGDLVASGNHYSQDNWQIAITHPRPQHLNGYIARFALRDRAAATSGDYLNHFTPDFSLHHIIDPYTCISPKELASVSVIGPDAVMADALSTALMILPLPEGIAFVNSLPEVEALFVTKDLVIRRTSGFPVL